MNLYRIILVDDEEEVRKGIIRKIDWETLGFQVVGDAENGEEALEMIEQLEPDLVMTDIRMPYMDGLTLSARIRQKYPSIKILIFSGYDDFEYAQQAIKLNVTEYILKPVNVEELTEILIRVYENLEEEIEQRRDVTQLRERYRRSLPIIRELFLNDLVKGNADASFVKDRLREYQVDILGARKWIAVVVDVEAEEGTENSSASLHRERELIPISVRQLVEDHLKSYYRFAVFSSTAGLVLIVAVDADNTQTGLINILEDICKEIKKILEVTVTIGIGHSAMSLDQMGKSYQSALDALGYKAIVGAGRPIYINDVEPVNRGKLLLDDKDEADLTAAVKFGGREAIEQVVQRLISRMDDARVHMRQYQAYMISIINCLTRLMQQYDMSLEQIFDQEERYLEVLTGRQSRENFAAWLIQVACRMHETMNLERDRTAKRVIVDAKQYIMDHYQDPDLSVEMLCRELHMSPAYFSTMFKKETGQTYVAYLTEIRLNRAVELLNETDDKTYIIAQKVGYQEQNYFSYVFKKKFGVSPTKYRSSKA